jgi:tetratricopeptide (TPR) repeat protein
VPAATNYWVQWTSDGVKDHSSPVEAWNVLCSESLEDRPICLLPWPEGRAALSPGKTYFLRVAARSGASDSWHFKDPVKVEIQETPRTARLERELEVLEALGLENSALDIARAGLFAENGLYADAADQYRRILIADVPELRVTLADLDFMMGLDSLAEPRYREALAGHVPSVRAAAAFGFGRVAYARGRYEEAAAAFRQARELYGQLGLAEEENAARQALGVAEARIPR